MLAAFDIMLILIAFIIMFKGLSRRRSMWRKGREEYTTGSWSGLLGYIFGHKKILEKRKRGIVHLLLFWSFLIPIVAVILAQFELNLSPFASKILSLFMDLLGIILLTGTCYFLISRIRSKDPGGPDRTIFPMILVIIIVITGFLAEGSRLSIVGPGFQYYSPGGWLLSLIIPPSPLFMFIMIRIHFLAVLFLIAALPFTFIRHLISIPMNIFFRRRSNPGALMNIPLDKGVIGARSIKDFSWRQLLNTEACVACGRCEENCPAFISGKPLSPRRVIRDILDQMEAVDRGGSDVVPAREDEIWSCTTCMACAAHCPVFAEPMDKIIDMRRYMVIGTGRLPTEASPLIRNLEIFGDVQGKGTAYRSDWTYNLEVPSIKSLDSNHGVLLWVGCSGAFHPRYQEVSRSMVHILKTANIPFNILGREELCCGDPARRIGDESLFLELAGKNIQRFKDYNVKEIVCLCPHCFNTLKNEYPWIEGYPKTAGDVNPQIYHASDYIMKLIYEKRISPRYPINKDIAFHDPCYLGRVNSLYNPPREIIKSLPGTRMRELERHHKNAFCCGGGGGGMWFHERLGRRINIMRAEEVLAAGADVLGTACPYCLTMLDDGLKSLDAEKTPKVMDIVEILAYSI